MPGCFPSCLLVDSIANCASRNLRLVPALPPNITHLFLSGNYISEINSTSLSGLEQLQDLDLGLQHVPLTIRNYTFSRQRRLKRLGLDSNINLKLEPHAFVGLSSLQKLDLTYCSLQDSILTENYLEPLSSLETLNLFGNQIRRLQPSTAFANMTNLKDLNLKLNKIDKLCEPDLVGFQDKHFKVLNLQSIHLRYNKDFDWEKCGNPFRGMSFETLDLSHNGLSMATSKQFLKAIEGTKISHLILSGLMGKGFSFSNFLDPDHSTFEGLKSSSLRVLDLSKSQIFALKKKVFSSLKEVVVIDVSQNKVNQIDINAFEGLQGHLKLLNLSRNLLGEIYSHTFASLKSLRVLDLSHNHIGVLGYNSFQGLPNLKLLDLTGNSLRDLGFPASLPRLDYLLLGDNRLSSVSSITSMAGNIMHLNVEDNKLTTLNDVNTLLTQLRRLGHLFYGGNTIKWCTLHISAAALKHFLVLDLHGSSLQDIWSQGRCLNLFDNLEHVLGLNLSFNALQSLPQGIFKGLTSVVQMDLSSNALTYLQPGVLPKSLKLLHLANNFIASPDPDAFRSLSILDVKMNRFHCNDDLKSFLTWMSKTNVTFLSPVEELRCEFPSRFHDVRLLDYVAQVALK